MKISKKFRIAFYIVIIAVFIFMPNFVHAELSDAQRQAIVNVSKEIAKLAERGVLRYTQATPGRNDSGFNDLTKVTRDVTQKTPFTWTLTSSDASAVLAKLNSEIQRYGGKPLSSLPQPSFYVMNQRRQYKGLYWI